jgi:hypothetical protein
VTSGTKRWQFGLPERRGDSLFRRGASVGWNRLASFWLADAL